MSRIAADGAVGVKRTTVTLTDGDRAELAKRGGSVWVRRALAIADQVDELIRASLQASQAPTAQPGDSQASLPGR